MGIEACACLPQGVGRRYDFDDTTSCIIADPRG
jgi:hypothetical protein